MAPEVINCCEDGTSAFNPKCDVFSAGIIFYKMLTGKIPFEGKNFEETFKNNEKGFVDIEVEDLVSVPCRALSLLRGMLESNPEDRFSAKSCL